MYADATSTAVAATSIAATATYAEATHYPPYLPGSGTLALYDPLRNDSKGYEWNPPKYSGCNFIGGTLHVRVYGDDTNPVYFHACIGKTPIFNGFAYEIKMTFIEGDCGGIIFRSHDPHLYYFYICQDGQYGFVRYTGNVLDTTINPILREGYSPFIVAGSSQANVIAIVAQGSRIDLYVNQQRIDSAVDVSYHDGTIPVVC